MDPSPGAVRSPNIWDHPAVYEIENRAVDPEGLIEQTMASVAGWDDRVLLDVGCGTGFHLRRWASSRHGAARSVIGVEPHPGLVAIARRRVDALAAVDVRQGSATDLPLPDASVDVVHARWAYFLGPGCEPGLRELDRVVRRGGTAFVIDNDASRSTFGTWFARGYPHLPAPPTQEWFWSSHGWERHPLMIRWAFETRADLEAVVRIEFDPTTAAWILAGHEGTGVDYAVNLWVKSY